MSLSVPQNGVKGDNEPVIELFVKVRIPRFVQVNPSSHYAFCTMWRVVKMLSKQSVREL